MSGVFVSFKNKSKENVLLIAIANQLPFSPIPLKTYPVFVGVLAPGQRVLVSDNLGTVTACVAFCNMDADKEDMDCFLKTLRRWLIGTSLWIACVKIGYDILRLMAAMATAGLTELIPVLEILELADLSPEALNLVECVIGKLIQKCVKHIGHRVSSKRALNLLAEPEGQVVQDSCKVHITFGVISCRKVSICVEAGRMTLVKHPIWSRRWFPITRSLRNEGEEDMKAFRREEVSLTKCLYHMERKCDIQDDVTQLLTT